MKLSTDHQLGRVAACVFAVLFMGSIAPNFSLAQTAAQTEEQATENKIIDSPPPSDAPGASPEKVSRTVTVMGFKVVPHSGTYRVTADANVRMGPGTKHKRISSVLEGERIQSIGQLEGMPWFAVSRDGETLGFIHNGVLKAVVDGTIGEEIRDRIVTENVACDYRFRFEGRSPVEGANFDTADYEVLFRCANAIKSTIFYGHMFLTEAPIDRSGKRHQIGFDVRSIGDGLEKYLSSNFYYDPTKGELTFSGHSLPRYALQPSETRFEAQTPQAALLKALEIAVLTWTPEAWSALLDKDD